MWKTLCVVCVLSLATTATANPAADPAPERLGERVRGGTLRLQYAGMSPRLNGRETFACELRTRMFLCAKAKWTELRPGEWAKNPRRDLLVPLAAVTDVRTATDGWIEIVTAKKTYRVAPVAGAGPDDNAHRWLEDLRAHVDRARVVFER